MSIKERIKAPQVALTAILLKLAGYLVVGGMLALAVCQTVTGKGIA